MIVHRAVIVHGLAQASLVLETAAVLRVRVALLSAPGAGCFAGCLWWSQLVCAARCACPQAEPMDILDCADASGHALAALHAQVNHLVLWPDAPGRAAVAAIAVRQGGMVLAAAPEALDMAARNAPRRLPDWLWGSDPAPRDSAITVG